MKFQLVSFAVIAAASLMAASSASALDIVVNDVETGNGNYNNVSAPGHGTPWTTPILLTDSHKNTYIVFCDDLEHDINVGNGQLLPFTTGFVTIDGNGNALSMDVSNVMGQIADKGRAAYLSQLAAQNAGNDADVTKYRDLAIAAQAAIWEVEYSSLWNKTGDKITSSDPTISQDIADYLKDTLPNGTGYAIGLYNPADTARVQSQIIGSAAPEPSAWSLMILGVGGMGAALRTRRRKAIAAA